jgi:protein SSD1
MASLTSNAMQGNRINVHRRTQTATAPMLMGQGNVGLGGNSFSALGTYGGALGVAPQGEDGNGNRGHGRRHSVNVLNKQSMGGFGQGIQDGFEDGFAPPAALGGHSRNPSRVDPAWRMHIFSVNMFSLILISTDGNTGNNFGLQDNLDQAQQQLRSLQQFRAAAGGHHQKMASFSFPNMLPNMMAANMMGLNAMNLNMLQQQQQQFQVR